MVIWSMGIRTFDYSLFRVIANVPQAVAHGRVGQRSDHATVDESGVVGHVVGRGHLDRGVAFPEFHEADTQPPPCGRYNLCLAAHHSRPWPSGTGMQVEDARATRRSWSSKTSASLKRRVCRISTTRPTARRRPW